ncbi:MAG: CarD family transcriptional regulator [Oscillospiraceae bacterium]|nr:CarD family transcriptional regulator [Oscillospiraceae bacterium]
MIVSENIAFDVGDKIVHPMHGAGVIEDIINQKINGMSREYYIFKVPSAGMLVQIPVHSTREIGIRAVVDSDTAEGVFIALTGMEIECTSNWSRRYRENMIKIKSGELLEVASVVKSLSARERQKGLSTAERKMLHSAKQILISEIMLAQSAEYDAVEERLNGVMA